jgi:hypothetical protein
VKKIFILLSVLFYAQSASAILDGRAAPIYLDTRYTFTNYEWARGIVYFNDGFDVAPGGTIFLGLDGGRVRQSVELSGGTLCLQKSVEFDSGAYITGSGFIDADFSRIDYRRGFPGVIDGSGYIKFLSPIGFSALGKNALFQPEGVIDLRGIGTGAFTIRGSRVTLKSNRILTDSTSPPVITFDDCYIALNSDVTFNNPEIVFGGDSTLITKKSLLTVENVLTIRQGGAVKIASGSMLNLGGLNARFSADLEIRNSDFDFTSTGTSPIRIGHPLEFQGTLSFVGQSIFRSSTNNQLRVDPALDLEFLSGSRLIIDEGVHLTIE